MKYELGQLIWFLKNNKVYSTKIFSRQLVENSTPAEKVYNDAQRNMHNAFGPDGVFYSTVFGTHKETEIFASKEELLASL